MNQDTNCEVFRGSIEECLQHLDSEIASRAPKGSREITASRQTIAEFCGVTNDSVWRWLSTAKRPVAVPYFKLVCYLYLIGYRIVEVERLSKSLQHFTELLGYGLITVDEALELTGYSEASTLYQVLMGTRGISEDRSQKMWMKWKEMRDELTRRKVQEATKYRLPTVPVKRALGSVKPEVAVRALPQRHRATVSIMEGLSALLEDESFEAYVAGHPQDLQQSANMISGLSARLSLLTAQLVKTRKGG